MIQWHHRDSFQSRERGNVPGWENGGSATATGSFCWSGSIPCTSTNVWRGMVPSSETNGGTQDDDQYRSTLQCLLLAKFYSYTKLALPSEQVYLVHLYPMSEYCFTFVRPSVCLLIFCWMLPNFKLAYNDLYIVNIHTCYAYSLGQVPSDDILVDHLRILTLWPADGSPTEVMMFQKHILLLFVNLPNKLL